MKTSNKLFTAALFIILLAQIAVNIMAKKEISNALKNNKNTELSAPYEMKSDSIIIHIH